MQPYFIAWNIGKQYTGSSITTFYRPIVCRDRFGIINDVCVKVESRKL
jgi:hypothetical protein